MTLLRHVAMLRRTPLPHVQALGAVSLWDLSFMATKGALEELSPATLVFTRFGLEAALLD